MREPRCSRECEIRDLNYEREAHLREGSPSELAKNLSSTRLILTRRIAELVGTAASYVAIYRGCHELIAGRERGEGPSGWARWGRIVGYVKRWRKIGARW